MPELKGDAIIAVYYVSMGRDDDLLMPGGSYELLDFPLTYSDDHGMRTDDGYTITPAVAGVGCLELDWHLEGGDYSELRDVFVRDPYAVTWDPENRTGYDHWAPSPGMQTRTKTHWLKVKPDVPLGVRVFHNASVDRRVTHAQFKLTIFSDVV